MSEDEHRFELLADLGAMIARETELDVLLAAFADRVAAAVGAERATLWLLDGETGDLHSRVAVLPEVDELRVPAGRGVVGHVAATGERVVIADAAADPRWASDVDRQTGYHTRTILAVPVRRRGQLLGVLQIINKRRGTFALGDQQFAAVLAEQIGRALDYTTLRGLEIKDGVALRGRFNHVIGNSPAMRQIYDVVERAAATDATVLIRGETGTGKGVLARAIHANSARKNAPLVHVDCTTLPANLVESELFGHERGAFTGADARVLGKVEAAAGGTLFLDEVGELAPELQGKLLRFVQERQFERVGSRQVLHADVRLVAATNRDLVALVEAGSFRADLYYRLHVIELEVPPLRARGAADIVALAEHFLAAACRRHRREPMRIADDARAALVAHPWPGNVRELEHAIERAAVLSIDGVVEASELGLEQRASTAAGAGRLLTAASSPHDGDTISFSMRETMDDIERRFAEAVLRASGGNQSEAARRLGISRNRLARLLK